VFREDRKDPSFQYFEFLRQWDEADSAQGSLPRAREAADAAKKVD